MFKKRTKEEVSLELKNWITEQFVAHLAGNCVYCDEKLTVKNLSCDHRIPISRTGTNTIENLQFICMSCNFEKGNLTDLEYRHLVDFLSNYSEMRKIVRTRLKMSGIVYVKR